MLGMDGANEILRSLLGCLMLRKKDLTSLDWSDLQVPASDSEDEPPREYTVSDFDWGATQELVDVLSELRMVSVKTAGGCSGSQAPCDCGACFKCMHAQVKNPRHGDVLDEQIVLAARRAIDACPAVAHLKSRILHVVAKVSPVLASVFSKHNVQKSCEIPGVYPLDPLRVLSQFAGFENIPDHLRDELLIVIHTLADWCRENPNEPSFRTPYSLNSESRCVTLNKRRRQPASQETTFTP
jgi:hypothetical protein